MKKRSSSSRCQRVVRFGVIGLGAMGRKYCDWLIQRDLGSASLEMVCDSNEKCGSYYPDKVFTPAIAEILDPKHIDAVIIALPHQMHLSTGQLALRSGLHVLIEKPLAMTKGECEKLLRTPGRSRNQVFGVMLNERTEPVFKRLKEVIASGALGRLQRINWTITSCFRPESYYRESSWRGTWRGEGGGLLLNQCIHHLDIMHWLFGMPQRVFAKCRFGKYHRIEVEDEVIANFEYPNQLSATLIASSGEAPCANRLEIVADRGKVLVEDRVIHFLRNDITTSFFRATSRLPFATPPFSKYEMPFERGGQHLTLLKEFCASVIDRSQAHILAEEGAASVELANACLLSAWRESPVTIPISSREYEAEFRRRCG